MVSSLRAVLFDVDGTLTDSGPLIRHTMATLMKTKLGLDQPEVAYTKYVGPPLEDTFAELGVPEEEIAQYIGEYRAFYDQFLDQTPLFPGACEMLASVREAGFTIATATSKSEIVAKAVCDVTGLTPYIEVICGADAALGRSHKHHVIDHALTQLEERGVLDPCDRRPVQPLGTNWQDYPVRSDVVMVGDRNFDTFGAAVHGIATILVDWGEGDATEKAQAWRHVHTMDELVTLLRSY